MTRMYIENLEFVGKSNNATNWKLPYILLEDIF